MRWIRNGVAIIFVLLLCGFASGCKKACDDLADVCASCSSDYKSDCNYSHDVCDIFRGKAGDDCCEAMLDDWKETCK